MITVRCALCELFFYVLGHEWNAKGLYRESFCSDECRLEHERRRA